MYPDQRGPLESAIDVHMGGARDKLCFLPLIPQINVQVNKNN